MAPDLKGNRLCAMIWVKRFREVEAYKPRPREEQVSHWDSGRALPEKLEPITRARRGTDNVKAEGVFFFDPEDSIYADHFPGKPVVPGSLIIQAFLTAAREEEPARPVNLVRDFRFKRFVSPGEYRYSMEPAGSALKCRLYDGAAVVVTGMLES